MDDEKNEKRFELIVVDTPKSRMSFKDEHAIIAY